jgi:hypothetical protein
VQPRPEANATFQPSAGDFDLKTDLALRLEPQHVAALDSSNAALQIELLRVTRQRLYNLHLRKTNLAQPRTVKTPAFR